MQDGAEETWRREVRGALRRYGRPDELDRHAARSWPAVRALVDEGFGTAAAVRRVLETAVARFEERRPDGARLLREHYFQGRPINTLAVDYDRDASSLHRRRNKLHDEIAALIADSNRRAEQQGRVERFKPRQPVFGFDALAAELSATLRDPDGPLALVLEGMGGLGKTTLARMVAARCADGGDFRGVLWCGAQQVEFDLWGGRRRATVGRALNADDLVAELARELGIAIPADLGALRSEVATACKRARRLVIFDNLETVADMAAIAPLVELLAGPSRVLITTRDRAAEALPATLMRRYVVLHELDAPMSFHLLRAAAAQTGATALGAASDGDLGRIYDVTGGNPLALWLVAGQAQGMPWAAFLDDLAGQAPRGSAGYELYDYLYRRSWEQLSPDARIVLFAMHRCEAGATYQQLVELSGLDRAAFRRAANELTTRMLLMFDGDYTIHRLTYTFLRVVIAGWWE